MSDNVTKDGDRWVRGSNHITIPVMGCGYDGCGDDLDIRLTKEDLIDMLNEVSKVNGHAQHAPGLWQCPNDYCPVCMHDSMTQGCSPDPHEERK